MATHPDPETPLATVTPVVAPPRQKIRPSYLAVVVGMHLLALLAFLPYCWTWWAIPTVLLGNCLFGSLGVNLGYHRLLTHRSLVVPSWLEKVLVTLGVCSLEGPPIKWVTVHRIHHQHGDDDHDPHSPVGHFFWGHMGWTVSDDPRLATGRTFERYVPDLLTDPFMKWLHKRNRWLKLYLAHVLVIALLGLLVGWLVGDPVRGLVLALVWGVFVRTVYVWHITWLVNSAAHRWGYRNYTTNDQSTNCWWVALLTNGEGWHNNHHAAPRSARHGHKWYELDLTYVAIRFFQAVGLAKDVVPVKVASYKHDSVLGD